VAQAGHEIIIIRGIKHGYGASDKATGRNAATNHAFFHMPVPNSRRAML
jgi:hypothetical protein